MRAAHPFLTRSWQVLAAAVPLQPEADSVSSHCSACQQRCRLRRHRIVACDMRHHGETVTDDASADLDFSKETLREDVVALWREMFAKEAPPTVLVGHSVGGAIAVWTACLDAQDGITSLEGLVVIDVVEGTALGVLRAAFVRRAGSVRFVTSRLTLL